MLEAVVMNQAMNPTFAELNHVAKRVKLDRATRKIVAAGFTVANDRLYLAREAPTAKRPWREGFWPDAFTEEWNNNAFHLDSSLGPENRAWRRELVRKGIAMVEALLPLADQVAPHPVQAMVILQSSAEHVDPEIDFAVAKVKFYQLRHGGLDARETAHEWRQPVAVFTAGVEKKLGKSLATSNYHKGIFVKPSSGPSSLTIGKG